MTISLIVDQLWSAQPRNLFLLELHRLDHYLTQIQMVWSTQQLNNLTQDSQQPYPKNTNAIISVSWKIHPEILSVIQNLEACVVA